MKNNKNALGIFDVMEKELKDTINWAIKSGIAISERAKKSLFEQATQYTPDQRFAEAPRQLPADRCCSGSRG